MPELILEIGGRVFEGRLRARQEPSLEARPRCSTSRPSGSAMPARSTEKRMLLLAGLMLADTMTALQEQLLGRRGPGARRRGTRPHRRGEVRDAGRERAQARDRGSHKTSPSEVAELREENEAAAMLMGQVLAEISALADAAEGR